MIAEILDAVRQVWHTLEITEPMPNSIHYVLQSRHRVILFLFAEGNGSHPLVVVKLARTPAQNHLLERSVKRASHIRTLLDDEMKATVPLMSLLRPINGLLGIAEPALPGEPFETATATSSWDTIANGCAVFADWLVRFQAHTRMSSQVITAHQLESVLSNTLEKISVMDHRSQTWVKALSKELIGLQIPLVWAYGDAHPSNILLENGRVSGVVDWEGATSGQWPVFDWFQFLLSLAQELIKARCHVDRVQRAVMACRMLAGPPTTRLAKILQEQTERYLSLIGLDPKLALPLFLVFLIHYYWFEDKGTLLQRVLTEQHTFLS